MIARRSFVKGATTIAAGGLFGLRAAPAMAEPPLETTKIRLVRIPGICIAPQYVADDILRSEGFTEVSYVQTAAGVEASRATGSGEADFSIVFAGPVIMGIDAGNPIVVLAGVHVGCFELFATDRVRTVRDLKGKTVAVQSLQSSQHIFLSSMAAYVGLDPARTSRGPPTPRRSRSSFLRRGRSTPSWHFLQNPRSCARKRSATSS